MNSGTIKLIIVLLAVCLLSILALQGIWIRSYYVQNREQFGRTVYAALEETEIKMKEREKLRYLQQNTYIIKNGDTIVKTPSRKIIVFSKNQQVVNKEDHEGVIVQRSEFRKESHLSTTIRDSIHISRNEKNVNIILNDERSETEIPDQKNSKGQSVKGTTIYVNTSNTNDKAPLKDEIEKFVDRMVSEINIENEKPEPSDSLNSVIKKVLHSKGIFAGFEFSFRKIDGKKEQIIAQSPGFNEYLEYYTGDFSVKNILNTHEYLQLQFPKKDRLLLAEMKGNLILSVFFTITIILIFYYTVQTILKQKKFSDIKDDFVNNMTHELKTPIATISLAVDAINNPMIKNDEDKFNDYRRILKEENKKLNGHVERVLQMALLDKSELLLDRKPISLLHIIDETIKNYYLQLERQHAEAGYITMHDEVLILADETAMQAVFNNLMDNALKYSGEGCVIRLHVVKEKDWVIVKFKDNGIGIPQQHKDKVFEKFYRVNTGDLHAVKGFGLGLSYVRSIIEAHGGTITLNSEQEKGCEFTIRLKVYEQDTAG